MRYRVEYDPESNSSMIVHFDKELPAEYITGDYTITVADMGRRRWRKSELLRSLVMTDGVATLWTERYRIIVECSPLFPRDDILKGILFCIGTYHANGEKLERIDASKDTPPKIESVIRADAPPGSQAQPQEDCTGR